MADSIGMVAPAIFQDLQQMFDDDVEAKKEINEIVQTLEKRGKTTRFILAQVHSKTVLERLDFVAAAESATGYEIEALQKLAETASKYPYYKWSSMWMRQVQDTTFHVLLTGWLGGFKQQNEEQAVGRLLTLEDTGGVMKIPVNLKDRDAFHLTIEEYLHALISLVEELTRLARNSVTLGDYQRPLQISKLIKDLHSGFQILNLKNDSLRRRSDSIKYKVKEVEDVVYDLSLRNLVNRSD